MVALGSERKCSTWNIATVPGEGAWGMKHRRELFHVEHIRHNGIAKKEAYQE
jgi:hypothetical protein